MATSGHTERPEQPEPTDGTPDSAPERVSEGVSAGALRYDAFYRGESPLREIVGEALTPWDIDAPQPEVVALERSGQITGSVLDAGFGTGDNAFFLHRAGYRVTGFDGSPHAVARAAERAAAEGAGIEFTVADATALSGPGDPLAGRGFDTVLDSALYHCLDADLRRGYVEALHTVCRPGGRLHLLCFSDAAGKPNDAVHYIDEDELRDVLSADAGWRITTLRRTRYLTAFTHAHVERGARAFGYDAPDTYLRSEFDGADEHGRLYAPAWLVSAERV
ncbi:class I SAM-dependent methyltransferase [Streptomyces sp. NPDC054796]